MKTPPPAAQFQFTSSQPAEHPQSASGAHSTMADELNPDQLVVRVTTFTPQLRALLAETGRGDSGLND